jgi:hypothetical protein
MAGYITEGQSKKIPFALKIEFIEQLNWIGCVVEDCTAGHSPSLPDLRVR